MKKGALVSLRIEEDLAARLERLARATHRTKSFIASQAIEEYLALQEWQVEAIQEGLDDIARGDVVGHAEVLSALAKWGGKRPDAA